MKDYTIQVITANDSAANYEVSVEVSVDPAPPGYDPAFPPQFGGSYWTPTNWTTIDTIGISNNGVATLQGRLCAHWLRVVTTASNGSGGTCQVDIFAQGNF